MVAGPHSRLLALNDSRLHAFLSASGDARSRELERLFQQVFEPFTRNVVARYVRKEWLLQPDDVDEVVAQVRLKLLRKLFAALLFEEESIQSVDGYLVTLTQNALRDLMRSRAPERSRLKSRLRYLFQCDDRLAIWLRDSVTVAGLEEWRDREPAPVPSALDRLPQAAGDAAHPAEALVALMRHLGAPATLEEIVQILVSLWHITELDGAPRQEPALLESHDVRIEARQYLLVLWEEILLLPPRQRAALLLNLREPGGGNGVLLFVVVGIASIEAIADAAGFSRQQWLEIWEQLPLDDLTIGRHLEATRQQVINLRRAARDRLSRRMTMRSGGRSHLT